mmetsp:Transcript_46348/g.110345  ORF Transcript_46348/g.110345 Transcript_46348/m.110345 type:complete len:480 (-) Transcript_46348:24-1463(-)
MAGMAPAQHAVGTSKAPRLPAFAPPPAGGGSPFLQDLGTAPAASTGAVALSASAVATALVGAAGAARHRRRHRHGHASGRGRMTALPWEKSAPSEPKGSRTYYNFTGFPFPLGPFTERRTVRKQVGDGMWTFEQVQCLANISINVRMTVIKLECGGLWVHNPIAPTEECINMIKELGAPVKYIVLGTTQYEHKIFVGPLSRRWPEAQVYTVPQQWSWPIDLPPALVGIFSKGDLKDKDTTTPWAGEIEQRLLEPDTRLGLDYSCVEAAFYHKRSKSLICTDALVYVPNDPPEVLDREELIALGRNADNVVLDLVGLTNWRGSGELVRKAKEEQAPRSDADFLRIGWQRDALLALFFGPDGASLVDPTQAFGAIQGKWIVGPVTYSLVYGGPFRQAVLRWVDSICEWDIQQIIPCHFAGPVAGSAGDIRRAFEVLQDGVEANEQPGLTPPWPLPQPVRYRAQDIRLLDDISGVLRTLGVV